MEDISMLKHISNSSSENNVQVDEKLWNLQQVDAGWLKGNMIPGRSDNTHAGVVLARISKKQRSDKSQKGHKHG
jgi:hypothetical protein